MLTADEVQALRDLSINIMQPIQEYIISDISARIAHAGQLTSTADYLSYRAKTLGVDWGWMQTEVARQLKVSVKEVERLYEAAAHQSYADEAKRLDGLQEMSDSLLRLTRAAKDSAGDDLRNVTRTMGLVDRTGQELPLKEFYGKAMDFVHYNVASGAMDYNTAVRLASGQLADKGITSIGYQSGVRTSLEAAVRRNVMGGIGLMTEKISQYNHAALGANGWEMSAHAMSAPDHEPHQGKQYPDAEWIKLNGLPPLPGEPANQPQVQGELKRRVGTLNCGHTAAPIIIGVSRPQYTTEQLAEFKKKNEEGVTVDGVKYSLFEATQKQRGLERRIRALERQDIVAKASGDQEQMLASKAKLTKAEAEYRDFSKAAGLRTQYERLHTAGWLH